MCIFTLQPTVLPSRAAFAGERVGGGGLPSEQVRRPADNATNRSRTAAPTFNGQPDALPRKVKTRPFSATFLHTSSRTIAPEKRGACDEKHRCASGAVS